MSALLLLLYGSSAFAQQTSVSIPVVEADAGSTVNVPINVSNFNDVGSLTLVIDYDAGALTFNGIENAARDGFNVNASGGEIRIVWFDQTANNPINITSGKLLDLNFDFVGGSTALTIDAGASEVTDSGANPFAVSYSSGSVAEEAGSLTLGTVEAPSIGQMVEVPVTASGLNDVGSVSLVIDFNPAVLDFVSFTDASGMGLAAGSPQAGQVNIGGFSTSGVDLDGAVGTLTFEYLGGVSALTFDGSSEVTNVGGGEITTQFNAGLVAGDVATVSIPTVGGVPGDQVVVPVLASDLNGVGSVSLSINYDPSVLTFVDSQNGAAGLSLTTGTPTAGTVNVGGFSTTAVDVGTGTLIELVFNYHGGATDVSFDASSEFTNVAGTELGVVFVAGRVVNIADLPGGFEAVLAGINEVPPIVTSGHGHVSVTVVGRTVVVSGEFDELLGPIATNIRGGAHIHAATVGENGPIVIELNPTIDADERGGVFLASNNTINVDALTYPEGFDADIVLNAIQNGGAYVNVHTPPHGGGEIRGQILTVGNSAPSASALSSPENGASLLIEGDREDVLTVVSATESVDAEGDEILYFLQASAVPNFAIGATTLLAMDGPFSEDVTVWEAADLFDAVTGRDPGNIWVGGTIDLYLRVLTTDGSRSTAGPTTQVSLTRGSIVKVPTPAELPGEFALRGNYPNPFNPTTTIRFDLPSAAQVSVQVFDMLGRQVADIPAKAMSAGQNVGVDIEAGSLSSGTYVYRVTAETVAETLIKSATMTLMK